MTVIEVSLEHIFSVIDRLSASWHSAYAYERHSKFGELSDQWTQGHMHGIEMAFAFLLDRSAADIRNALKADEL